jgi:hypothetical protein
MLVSAPAMLSGSSEFPTVLAPPGDGAPPLPPAPDPPPLRAPLAAAAVDAAAAAIVPCSDDDARSHVGDHLLTAHVGVTRSGERSLLGR